MTQPTQRYKRTLKGSIGAGVQSVLGSDRRFYILEHKISSKYHKTGENQQIIVDQIELGRASTCQVRFDESFPTVSRRHAASVRTGISRAGLFRHGRQGQQGRQPVQVLAFREVRRL